jgi:methylase of polypeptide subunit release factors
MLDGAQHAQPDSGRIPKLSNSPEYAQPLKNLMLLSASNPHQQSVIDHGLNSAEDRALAGLLRGVRDSGYRFVTPTPLTHARVLAREPDAAAADLRDIFGWNRPFAASALPPAMLTQMDRAGVLHTSGALLRSAVRIAAIGDDLFLHSSYPTTAADAVFFGPDTYRFARFLRTALRAGPSAPVRLLDIGCGSGAGAIVAARALMAHGAAPSIVMNDINPLALRYTAVNAAVAGIPATLAHGDALSAVNGDFDLIISNPPYLDDDAARAYRHGGARLGRALSVRFAREALARLAPGAQLLLYTGVVMLDAGDPLRAELLPLLEAAGCDWSYDEIDPDVFGEELDRPVYAHAERIAAVGLIATRRHAEHG